MIELQNLSKTFQSNGKDVKAVDSVSLTVNEGEICVFLGPSGCGKSTTLKMINRLIKPTSGKILINGDENAYFSQVRYVFDQARMIGFEKVFLETRMKQRGQ